MAALTARERKNLPDRAFAYIDAHGTRRLPMHDESHVRNALARFDRVKFENDAARERARRRLLQAAKRYGIVPVGFIDGQLRSERSARTPDYSTFPTGNVTFVMTDIERSTVLLQRLEDRYASVLREVRTVIRSAARRCGGRLVDAHGDESLTVFERTPSAVEAAIDLQREMRSRERPDDLQMRLRVGIHAGRPTLTESGYVGLAVNTVARVCFVGHGGQILLSGKTKRDVQALLPTGARARTLGRHRLAGLAQPVPLFQVEAKGLATRFPALRTGPTG